MVSSRWEEVSFVYVGLGPIKSYLYLVLTTSDQTQHFMFQVFCNIIKYLKPVLFCCCCCFPSDGKPLHNTASIQCQETFKIYQQLLCLEMLCACKEVAHGSTQQHWSMDCCSAKRVWTKVQDVAIDWNVSLTLGVYGLKEEVSWSSGTRQLFYTSICLKLQKPATKLLNR